MSSTRIDMGREDGPLRLFPAPLIPGDWTLPDHAGRHWIAALWSAAMGEESFFLTHDVPELRWRPLPFYPGHMLVEAAVRDVRGRIGAANAVIGPDGCTRVDGNSSQWHLLNERMGFRLDNADMAAAYLEFFCSAIRGSDGRFRLVTQVDASCFTSRNVDISRAAEALRPHARPISLAATDEGFAGDVLVLYGGNAFQSSFVIRPEGYVEMEDDREIALEDMSLLARERCVGDLRWRY